MLRRIQKTGSVYSVGKWKKSRLKNEYISHNISRNASRISNKFPASRDITIAGPMIRDILRERASRPGSSAYIIKPVLGYDKSDSRPGTTIIKTNNA